jgi:hypothetical protein
MAAGNPDLNAWQSYQTPEAVADLQREWKKDGLSPEQQQAQLKAYVDGFTSGSDGFHIVNEQMTSPDQAMIDLSFDGEDAVRTFVLKQIDGQWKLDDMRVAGQTAPGR